MGALKVLISWDIDGLGFRGIKRKRFQGKNEGLEADGRQGGDGYREISENGFREIAKKTDSFVFLSLIRLMLKIFQFVIKITMN